jgi:hypothetical protein
MLPGIPVEADDSLELGAMGAAIEAAEDAQQKFERLGQKLISIRIWKGRLIALGTEKTAFVYFLPCKRCRKDEPVYT